MSGWIFAKGSEAMQTLTAVTPAAATSIALAGADQIFAVGQRLLISEADGSETQWLGKVTAVTSNAVSFARGLKPSKNSGAKLWRSASALAFPADAVLPGRREVDSGVATLRSMGGTYYALQVAQPVTSLRLQLTDLPQKTEDEALGWLADEAQWGLEPFTLIDPTAELAVVRLAGEPVRLDQTIDKSKAGGGALRHCLTLGLIIVQEGSYQ